MIAVLEDRSLAEIEAPTRGRDVQGETQRRAERLIAGVDGDRESLFELRSLFILRLHASSDDFGATEGLRVVERAIALLGAQPVS